MAERTYIQAITDTMWEEMERDEKVFLLGQDIGRYGGVFKATAWRSGPDGQADQSRKMYDEFGPLRVLDAPLAENCIIGAAIGAAVLGWRPIAEIQFMDFIDCATGHIVNQAGVMCFKTNGAWACPLTIRTPYGGDIGGGITHSQSNEAWYCHAAGLVVVAPSTAEDAAGLLRSCIRCDDPCLFIEHKKLYRSVKGEVTGPEHIVPLGKARLDRVGTDLTIVAYGNMLVRAREAADRLEANGASVEIIDPRTLWPLDEEAIVGSVVKTGRCVVVSEAHSSYGFASEIAARVQEGAFWNLLSPVRCLAAPDTPYPFAPAMEKNYLPSVGLIERAGLAALGDG